MKESTGRSFSPQEFGPVIGELLAEPRLAPLGPGKPDRVARERLKGLPHEALLAPQRVVDQDMAAACLAGLWLHFDCLDESHAITQALHTTEGSYWHVLAQMPQMSCTNDLASITHAILHATVGQYLALLTGWLSLLSETDAADRPAEGQHRQVRAKSRAGQWGLGLRDGGLRT